MTDHRTSALSKHPVSQENSSAYNYDHFDVSAADVERNITAGDEAIDVPLYTLDGETVHLADLWADNPIVVEFGSITCPVFTSKVETMDALANKYADEVDFYVIYTREAHPGQDYPAHRNLDEKLSNAVDACEYESIDRTILVDEINGAMHTRYVSLPNAAYVIGIDGIVAHQADWLDPETIDDVLESVLNHGGHGEDVTPTSLRDNFEKPTSATVSELYRVLSRAGPGSLRDFVRTLPRMLLYRFRKRLGV
jgi:peroxiredoxin